MSSFLFKKMRKDKTIKNFLEKMYAFYMLVHPYFRDFENGKNLFQLLTTFEMSDIVNTNFMKP